MLMISSELEEVIEDADRVFVLRDGRTVAELEGEDISEKAMLHAMADGRRHGLPGTGSRGEAGPMAETATAEPTSPARRAPRHRPVVAEPRPAVRRLRALLVLLIAFNLAFTPNFAHLADAERQPHPGLHHRRSSASA